MCMTLSHSAWAMMNISPSGTRTTAYSSTGLSAMARLPGSVQIVVVQITKDSRLSSRWESFPRSSFIGKRTYTVVTGSS